MTSRLTPLKLVTFGGTVATIAAAVGVYILAANQKGGFFRLDGWIVTVAFAIGTMMALVGLLRRGEDGDRTVTMTQNVGDNSVRAQQAGGNIINYDSTGSTGNPE